MVPINAVVKPKLSKAAIIIAARGRTGSIPPSLQPLCADVLLKKGGTVKDFLTPYGENQDPFYVSVEVTVKGYRLRFPFLESELECDEAYPLFATTEMAKQGDVITLIPELKDTCKNWLLENWFGDPSMGKQAEKVIESLCQGIPYAGHTCLPTPDPCWGGIRVAVGVADCVIPKNFLQIKLPPNVLDDPGRWRDIVSVAVMKARLKASRRE